MFLIRTTNKKAEVGRTMKKKLMIFLVLSLLLVSGCSSSDESSDSEKKIWKKWIFQTSPKT